METETHRQIDDLELFRRRVEILSGAKLREMDRLHAAIKIQDTIRSKSGTWSGSEVIRKWRQAR